MGMYMLLVLLLLGVTVEAIRQKDALNQEDNANENILKVVTTDVGCPLISKHNDTTELQLDLTKQAMEEMKPRDTIKIPDEDRRTDTSFIENAQSRAGNCEAEIGTRIQNIMALDPYQALGLQRNTSNVAFENVWKRDAKAYLDTTLRVKLWRWDHATWGFEQLWYRIVRFVVAGKEFKKIWKAIEAQAEENPSVEQFYDKFQELRHPVEKRLKELPDIAPPDEDSYLKLASTMFYTQDSLKVRSSHAMGMVKPSFSNHYEILKNQHSRGLYGLLWYALRMERESGKSFWDAVEELLLLLRNPNRVIARAFSEFLRNVAPFVDFNHFEKVVAKNTPEHPCLGGEGVIHYKESGKNWAWLHYYARGNAKTRRRGPQLNTMVGLADAEPFTRGEKELFYGCPDRTVEALPTPEAWKSGTCTKIWARGEMMYEGTDTEFPTTGTSWNSWRKYLWMDFDSDIGISGTTDLFMVAAQYLGFRTEELYMLRVSILSAMLPGRDHALIDILASANGFGVPLVPDSKPLVAILESLLPDHLTLQDLHGKEVEVRNSDLMEFLGDKKDLPCTTAECLEQHMFIDVDW